MKRLIPFREPSSRFWRGFWFAAIVLAVQAAAATLAIYISRELGLAGAPFILFMAAGIAAAWALQPEGEA